MENIKMEVTLQESEAPGVLQEILRTPWIKQLLQIIVRDVDAATAAELVRNILWEDSGLSLSLMGALPRFVNWLEEFLLELGRQIDSFPPMLLRNFLGRMGQELDTDRLAEMGRVYASILRKLVWEDDETRSQFMEVPFSAVSTLVNKAGRVMAQPGKNADEVADAAVRGMASLDGAALGRLTQATIGYANSLKKAFSREPGKRGAALLRELDARDFMSLLSGTLKGVFSAGYALTSWLLRSLVKRRKSQGLTRWGDALEGR